MFLPLIGSLIIGLTAGFLGQKSRMCFVGGFRDYLLVRDKELIKGIISFIVSAWLTIMILKMVGNFFPNIEDTVNVKYVLYPTLINAITSKFGLLSLFGGIGLGLLSTLVGGCPLRQHVMAGQGRKDSMVYLSGFYVGIIVYYIAIAETLAKLV